MNDTKSGSTMPLVMKNADMASYLAPSEYIDFTDPEVAGAASSLMQKMLDDSAESEPEYLDPEMQLAKICYEFVRDGIRHSIDIGSKKVVLKASEVLAEKEGLCYAKSHLLAALLRANGIPAALCYQYLRFDGPDSSLILHGLNAVYFESIGRWIRLDARGNKNGVDACFSIDKEYLAFPVRPGLGETDIPFMYSEPDRAVVAAINKYKNLDDLIKNLPSRLAGR